MKINALKLFSFILIFCGIVVAQNDTPKKAYGILFDNTGSMNGEIPRQKEIAKEIIKQIDGKGTISMFGFATDETSVLHNAKMAIGVECGSNNDLLGKQIDGFSKVRGQTALIDAVSAVVDRLGKPVSTTCSKTTESILIVMSDGEDRASLMKSDELIKILKTSGVKLYVIGLLDNVLTDAGFLPKSPFKKSKEFLESVVAASDGKIIFPKKKQTAEEIAKELFDVTPKKSK